jgi:hypothetical protein
MYINSISANLFNNTINEDISKLFVHKGYLIEQNVSFICEPKLTV